MAKKMVFPTDKLAGVDESLKLESLSKGLYTNNIGIQK